MGFNGKYYISKCPSWEHSAADQFAQHISLKYRREYAANENVWCPRRALTALWNRHAHACKADELEKSGGFSFKYSLACCRHSGHGRFATKFWIRASAIWASFSVGSCGYEIVIRCNHFQARGPHCFLVWPAPQCSWARGWADCTRGCTRGWAGCTRGCTRGWAGCTRGWAGGCTRDCIKPWTVTGGKFCRLGRTWVTENQLITIGNLKFKFNAKMQINLYELRELAP